MFAGLIKELGKVTRIINKGKDIEIEIESTGLAKTAKTGDSISVNGCCLTVKRAGNNNFSFDISFNTLKNTAFKFTRTGDTVNLEDSLAPTDKLGGHFVTGHIDVAGKILNISKISNSYKLKMELPPEILPYIVPKGSVSLDGISLTITETGKDYFCVVIIPHTFTCTNLKFKKAGSFVNIEVDLISRYIAHILKYQNYLNNNVTGDMFVQDKKTKPADDIKNHLLKESLEKYGFIK